ncbi:hypothetical protein NL108_000247 [Boleophthalmus pectinirostris]|nr:hypothetical protein NL108_000247 [Boleophthalmus pectinirostris]
MTVVGLITEGNEAPYRDELLKLSEWCATNNLALNIIKELILDFRWNRATPAPLYINGQSVERVESFKFLGVHISADLSWSVNTSALDKKAQQWLHFLLRKVQLNTSLLLTFYHSTTESLLTSVVTVWYSSCTEVDRKHLQRVTNTAQDIIGCPLPFLTTLYNSRCLSSVRHIVDSSAAGRSLGARGPSPVLSACVDIFTDLPPVAHQGSTDKDRGHAKLLTGSHNDWPL